MKKNLYVLLAVLAVMFTFFACSDDDDDAVGTQNPETEVAGTYTGTWNQVLTNSAGEVQSESEATGSVTISANRQWVVDLTLNVADPVIPSELQAVANCSGNSESGYIMVNNIDAALGSFTARMEDNVLTLVFTSTVTEGRKTYTATNTFEGTRN